MSNRLKNKIAIVIGASKGIGRGIANVFAKEGAKLIVTGRNKERLENVVNSLSSENNCVEYHLVDVTSESQINNLIKMVIERHGRIDVMCMNAGIYPIGWLGDLTLTQWNEIISTNLTSVFLATTACLPFMKEQNYGRIVVTSSISGPKVGLPGYSHYTASKAGITGFIRTAAIELAKYNITINAVEPGNIITEGFEAMGSEHVNRMKRAIPMGRLGTTDDVANATLFLASDEASFITGQTLVVDGGQVLPESLFVPFNKESKN